MLETNSVPILRLRDYLLVSIQTDLHDRMAEQLQHDILRRISETQTKGVLIDVPALEMVGSFIDRTLADTARMASTLDAEIVIVGMKPAVAITLIELGLSLGEVKTALNFDTDYDLLEETLASPNQESTCQTSNGNTDDDSRNL